MNRFAKGGSVKYFEWSIGLDTALYKNYFFDNLFCIFDAGIAHLHGYYVLETSRHGKKFGFTLIAPETKMRTFHFFAENQTDYTRWVYCAFSTEAGNLF